MVMKKNYFKSLMQASLLLGAAFVISSCDDVIGQEDNPVASYLQWQENIGSEGIELTLGIEGKNTKTIKAIAVSSAVIEYQSGDEKIATVNPVTGEIKAVGVGETVIKAIVKGASSAGKSVFEYQEIEVPVIVKDGVVSIKVKTEKDAAGEEKAIEKVYLSTDNGTEIDAEELFVIYPETGNTVTYSLVTEDDETYAPEGTGSFTTLTDGKLTIGEDDGDQVLYLKAEITDKASEYNWPEADIKTTKKGGTLQEVVIKKKEEEHPEVSAKVKINLREAIAYMALNEKGDALESKVLVKNFDKDGNELKEPNYKSLTTSTSVTSDLTLEAGTYYIDKNVINFPYNIRINGDVDIILKDGITFSLNYGKSIMDESAKQKYTLNIYGQKENNATINVPAFIDFKAVNFYGGKNVRADQFGKIETLNIYNAEVAKINNELRFAGIGTLNINNAKVTATAINMTEGGTITLNGGELHAIQASQWASSQYAITGNVVVNKGEFYAESANYHAVDGKLTAGKDIKFFEKTNEKGEWAEVKETETSKPYVTTNKDIVIDNNDQYIEIWN